MKSKASHILTKFPIAYTRTLSLIKCIDSGSVVEGSFDELVKLAKLNKVLLGFLRRTGYDDYLRAIEEDRYRRYMNEVVEVSKALGNLDCALFKFRKPVDHVSVDIDVLIRSEHLPKALRKLSEMGFKVEVLEPYTVTMIKDKTTVDLYTHPSFAWILYLDGERLLEETEVIELNNAEAKALTKEAEVVVAAAHAIYKEHIYLLADYYVIREWLNNKAIGLAKELNAVEAIQIALKINEQIEEGHVEAPIKLKFAEVVKVLSRKFMKDSIFRATTINTIRLAARKRTVQQLIWRGRRKSY